MASEDSAAAPEDGEIEISSSIWYSRPRPLSAAAFATSAAAPPDIASGCTSAVAPRVPPSPDIGVVGSGWPPGATALCHLPPSPLDTQKSFPGPASNAHGVLLLAR